MPGGGPSGGGGAIVGSAREECGRSLLLGGSQEVGPLLALVGHEEYAVVVGAAGGRVATGNKVAASGCGVALSSVVPWRLPNVSAKALILFCTTAPMLCATGNHELELAAVDDVCATGRDSEDSGISWRPGSAKYERNPKRLSIAFFILAR